MASLEPIVSWYPTDKAGVPSSEQVTEWDIGVVDAGSISPVTEFYIWNNKGGTVDVADMISCWITTKGTDGGDGSGIGTEQDNIVVRDKWVQACIKSFGDNPLVEDNWTPIGGATTKSIGAAKIWTDNDGDPGTPMIIADNTGKNTVISGKINDGDYQKTNNIANFAKVALRVKVPSGAKAGVIEWYTRVSYSFV